MGEVELDGKVLVLRRIHVTYRLRAGEEKREAAERAHSFHAEVCPLARSVGGSIVITTSLEIVGDGSS